VTATQTQTPTIDFNPFSPEVREDPYPTYAELRKHYPVYNVGPFAVISRYEDVLHVMKDPRLFSSAGMGEPLVAGRPTQTVVNADPPDHTRLRNLVNRAFTSRMVASLEPRISEITTQLLDAVGAADEPETDIIRDLAVPLPVIVIAEILGVEPEHREDFKRWSEAVVSQVIQPGQSPNGEFNVIGDDVDGFREYFEAVIAERRREPRDDLISALVRAENEDGGLTPDEVLAFTALLLVAGNETTTNLIGNAVLALLRNPDQLAKVLADPDLLPNVVEESLRHDSPVQMLFRRTTDDCEIAGVPIPAGSMVVPLFGSANRDDRRFSDPDRFDVMRDTQGHLAFGYGIHFCLGAPLARLEARVALEALIARLPFVELADDHPERVAPFFLRGLKSLALVFNPQRWRAAANAA
jgi:cytochrome P450